MRKYDLQDPDDRQFITEQSAATLVCMIADTGEESYQVAINGVRKNGIELGDWLITVEHIPPRRVMN